MEALEREKMFQSPIDFLSTCTAIKLLHSSCWNQWRVRSPKPTTLSSLHPSPLPICKWITCTEISGSTLYSNLVWIVLFFGFFEVISFSYSDISSGLTVPIKRMDHVDGMFDHHIPSESQRKLVFLSLLMLFLKNKVLGKGRGRVSFFIMAKNTCWLL